MRQGTTEFVGNVYIDTLTSGRVPYVTTSGLITNSANLTYDGNLLTATGDITVTDLLSFDEADWTGGNVIYVPVASGTTLQSYCTAATAGDTLVLGAGTYALTTNSLTPGKALTIIGQGVDSTYITFTTGMFTYSASNIKLENLTLSAASTAANYNLLNNTTDALTGLDMTNVKVVVTHGTGTGNVNAINTTRQISGKWVNVTLDVNSTSGNAYTFGSAFSGTAGTLDIYDSKISAVNTGTNKGSLGMYISDNSAANDFTINLYNTAVVASETGSSDGVPIYASGDSTKINVYNSNLNGTQYDAFQGTSATLTLSNCTLANNTTSGTITYAGTVVSNKVAVTTGNDGGAFINQAGTQFLVNDAKGKMINAVYSVVTPEYVKLFLIFDRTGAVTALKDYASIGGTTAHTATLSANASTLTPAIAGMCPNLAFTTSSYWSVADADDFTYAAGTSFSGFVLMNFTSLAAENDFLAKDGTAKREWSFLTLSADSKMYFNAFDTTDSGNYIGRGYNTALTGDVGSWHTYGFTYGGGTTSATIKLYRDGANVDNVNREAGTFVTMGNKAGTVGSSYGTSTTNATSAKYGVVLIVSEELTAVQAARLDAILRAYSGSDLN